MADRADNDSITFTLDGEDNNTDDDYEEEEEGEDVKLAMKLEKMSLKTKPSPMRGNTHYISRYTPTKTQIKKKYTIPPIPPCPLS
eukprot:2841340-Ditylum_brightwellii.AAC.1